MEYFDNHLFRTVAKAFAVGESMAFQITTEFCSEILRLTPRYIYFPRSRRETAETIEQFRFSGQCRILQVTGALDGTHISIPAPLQLMEKQIISVKKNVTPLVTPFLHKGLLEQILYFSTSQLGFQEAATMPVI